jgi:hypothetical protein
MSDTARQRLAFEQARLLGALTAGAAAPAGFDHERVAAAAESLLSKRAGTVARVWPRLAQAMKGEFAASFASYARAHPLAGEYSALIDGRAFIEWLAREGRLNDEGRVEAFAFDARYRISGGRITPRRGPFLRARRLNETRRLLVVIRLPLVVERWWNIKFL